LDLDSEKSCIAEIEVDGLCEINVGVLVDDFMLMEVVLFLCNLELTELPLPPSRTWRSW
jgi:hypothetical protein